MHELLAAASAATPVPGNAKGSYMTMRSKNGLIFGVINVIGNFATVFQDQAYWVGKYSTAPNVYTLILTRTVTLSNVQSPVVLRQL